MWSTTRALQFFIVTSNSLLIFDLSKSLEGPIVTYNISTNDLNNPNSILAIHKRWSVDGKLLALMQDDGCVVVHQIVDKYPTPYFLSPFSFTTLSFPLPFLHQYLTLLLS